MLTARFIIGHWFAKDLLKQESTYFGSIYPGFNAAVAEKPLYGIYWIGYVCKKI